MSFGDAPREAFLCRGSTPVQGLGFEASQLSLVNAAKTAPSMLGSCRLAQHVKGEAANHMKWSNV